ncbi:glycosyltransferase family 4 protein [Thomasclavelia cocleata]|uniref:glycosyltransferase family 4 protein n=1 Tax=Thomasclavelia cocleata TaxID=69824 RepID=UPI002431CEB5|nr:glycosyltransferase family 4 protein [Thomasclavelia cocleata]
MKILVISQYYYPEPFKVHEICEELVKRGNEVTVITGRPNYPEGNLIKGDPMYQNLNGVEVIRTNIILRRHNFLSLIFNYLSYPILAKKEIKKLDKEYDVVFVYQLSPVLMIKSALYYKKIFDKKVYVYCLDLWPESLKAIKLSEGNPIYRIMLKISNNIYEKCDFISVTSPAFLEYLENVNKINKDKLNVIYQHGEKIFLDVKPYEKQDKLNITFAGNIGKVQDFDCLVRAVAQIPNSYYSKLKITIIGSGSYEVEFKQDVKKKQLDSVFDFIGRKKVEELIPYYNDTSLFLLSLEKNSNIGKTIPSKLQTYLSAGRGIIGSIDGTAAKIISDAKAGITCNAGDYKALSKIIIELLNDENKLEEYAINSRKYFINNFTIEKYIDEISNKMEELV